MEETTKEKLHTAQKDKEVYVEAVGKRKTAVARVRVYLKRKVFTINDRQYEAYFPSLRAQRAVLAPLKLLDLVGKVGITAHIQGGGLMAQAEAFRHGLARALVEVRAEHKKKLRHEGYLTRDPRMVERKKYGLKKARRAPQWAKR